MFLVNASQMLAWKTLGDAHQSGPQASMDIRDLAVDEPADEHVSAVPHGAGQGEDLTTARMRPPAAMDGTAGDGTCERWHWTGARFEHDAVCSHERQSFVRCHTRCTR